LPFEMAQLPIDALTELVIGRAIAIS